MTPRRGMTLIELLVVVTIVLLIAAATLPRMKPAMERQRTREAARAVHLFFTSARQQAIATGRSCGVMIERLGVQPDCAMQLSQVESPPTYCGDSLTATATVTATTPQPAGNFFYCNVVFNPALTAPVFRGDLIQFGFQGPWFQFDARNVNLNADSSIMGPTFYADVDSSQGNLPFWQANYNVSVPSLSVPYRILRWPTKSAVLPLQLPSPAVIDLNYSGRDVIATDPIPPTPPDRNAPVTLYRPADSTTTPPNTPVVVMFSPTGAIDQVYYNSNASRLSAPIYFMIGKRDEITGKPGDLVNDGNRTDLANLWISINPQTGLVATTDMAGTWTATTTDYSGNAFASRTYARRSDSNGGQ